ncbi:hypothetical protein [Rhodopirellula sp. SWK7]|uniref:hypothetical protein n=1 Tax=Rhodopirellula sp. SWK7 TaxID=595460 RepID=UPI0002BF13A7|nr:hypothetical protein [Rhodopirellula sp. SWK7]EMI46097.1 putative secreted protein [Rhodopirellula sp. SWK7]
MSRTICVVAVLALIGVATVPLLTVAKWIGHFTLTVELDLASDIDAASISYVECWSADEARWLCNDDSEYVAGFEPPDHMTANAHSVTITCSGDDGVFDLFDTYHQPEFLVVRYRTIDSQKDAYVRKSLSIPPGRGPRTTSLTLP